MIQQFWSYPTGIQTEEPLIQGHDASAQTTVNECPLRPFRERSLVSYSVGDTEVVKRVFGSGYVCW